ncbi:molybdopterin-dependent oxidoreductase [Gemmatimonas sp.]|uniref:molybdopterin-dependent oxidoreductase n=3 Tax=Gemmatimonas sp. TaxID=1962908 RepID=UPI003561D437
MSTEAGTGVKRRDFLKILGATGATTAVVGCSSEKVGKLIPYVASPDNTVPGVSQYYATTCRECATACGVMAEVRDGRPIKLDGNPDHPMSRGAICSVGLSAVQGLYNPDRYRTPMVRKGNALEPITWDKAYELLAQKIGEVKSRTQASNVVFVNQHESGTFPGFLDQWLSAQGMPTHLSVDALAPSTTIAVNQKAYGASWPALDFNAAKLVISFGADFLDGWGHSVPQQLDWADARTKLADAPRLVYVGARRSLTGLNADQWIAAKPGSEMAICAALTGAGTMAAASDASGVPVATLEALAKAIATAGSGVMALCGLTTANAIECGVMVAEINEKAGAVGTTIKPAAGHVGFNGLSSYADLAGAVAKMSSGSVPLAFVRGANPAHTMPKSAGFAAAFAKVPFKVSFTSVPDETSQLCDLILPDNHWLESWGDAVTAQGQVGLQQPTLEPVFDTKATADVLIALAKKDQTLAAKYTAADYRGWFIGQFPGGASAFTTALTKATISGSPLIATATRTLTATATAADAGAGDYFVHVFPSPTLGDGRGANKPWLQELPDPVTKIAWQSWVEVHPTTFKKLGLVEGQHLTVETSAGKITAPAYRYMGVRPDTVAIALGQGHTAYGRFAQNVGVNAFDLLQSSWDASGTLALSGMKGKVTVLAETSQLVTTEGSARQHGRGIGQAMTLAALLGQEAEEGGHEEHSIPGLPSQDFKAGLKAPVAADAQGELANPKAGDLGMYAPDHVQKMAKRRWAMTIDLARCTGCSACVTACYSENNIPTVGAPYQGRALSPSTWDERPGANIIKGREMAWIRLERYYEGNENTENEFSPDFDTRFVPMMCQHCGNAPCEPVCPVYATYHSPDGLNVQVYNRCVGTRYCSNNCPYKVRYFNWFGYGEVARKQYAWPEPMHWALNPDVTVRGKGVMEKCTFCVQRIREAEHRAKAEGREVKPDEFTTACSQACPSRAIIFGDAADENWTVAKLAYDRRAYHVFEELNTYTAVVYLKKVNYPAPASPAQA